MDDMRKWPVFGGWVKTWTWRDKCQGQLQRNGFTFRRQRTFDNLLEQDWRRRQDSGGRRGARRGAKVFVLLLRLLPRRGERQGERQGRRKGRTGTRQSPQVGRVLGVIITRKIINMQKVKKHFQKKIHSIDSIFMQF